METVSNTNDKLIKNFCLGIGFALLAAAMAAMPFSGGFKGLLYGWREILISPCPLITDYFGIGMYAHYNLMPGQDDAFLFGRLHAPGCPLLLWNEFFKHLALLYRCYFLLSF